MTKKEQRKFLDGMNLYAGAEECAPLHGGAAYVMGEIRAHDGGVDFSHVADFSMKSEDGGIRVVLYIDPPWNVREFFVPVRNTYSYAWKFNKRSISCMNGNPKNILSAAVSNSVFCTNLIKLYCYGAAEKIFS